MCHPKIYIKLRKASQFLPSLHVKQWSVSELYFAHLDLSAICKLGRKQCGSMEVQCVVVGPLAGAFSKPAHPSTSTCGWRQVLLWVTVLGQGKPSWQEMPRRLYYTPGTAYSQWLMEMGSKIPGSLPQDGTTLWCNSPSEPPRNQAGGRFQLKPERTWLLPVLSCFPQCAYWSLLTPPINSLYKTSPFRSFPLQGALPKTES